MRSDCLSTICAAAEALPAETTVCVLPEGLTQWTVHTYWSACAREDTNSMAEARRSLLFIVIRSLPDDGWRQAGGRPLLASEMAPSRAFSASRMLVRPVWLLIDNRRPNA